MEAFARIIKGFTNQWYVNVFHLQLHQNRLKTFFLCALGWRIGKLILKL